MDSDGTRDARGTHANPVPRARSDMPPMPSQAPGRPPLPDNSAFLTWLRTPRPETLPGVWRFGHRPRPEAEPALIPGRQLISGALIAFLVGWLVWSLLQNGYVGQWWWVPLLLITPDSWRGPDGALGRTGTALLYTGYKVLVALIIMVVVGKLGRWGEVWRRFGPPPGVGPSPHKSRRPPPNRIPPNGPSSALPVPSTPPSGSPPRPGPGRCATSTTPASPVPGRACAVGGSGLARSPGPCSRTGQLPVCTPPGSGICPLGWLGTISSPGRCGWARPPTTPVIRTPIGGPGSGSGPSCSVPRCSPWGRPGPGRPGPSSGRSPSRCVCTPSPDGPPSW